MLDWAVGNGLRLMNTCFQKRKSRLVTFRSSETETMIDYILVNNKYKSSVRDVKVIPGEEIVSQHCLLLMDMVFWKKVKRKVKFRKKLKLWRLRESELKEEFAVRVNNKCEGNEDWYNLKSKLLDVAGEVCGYTKGKPRHSETWWWNKDVDVAVRRKRELFRIWRQSWNEEDRKKYCKAKKDAKRVVYMAMDQKAQEAVEKVDSSHDGCDLFRIAKQRAGEKSDVVGVSCLKDKSGAVKVSVDDRKKIWKEHMEKLMNVENEWSDSIDASKVEDAVRRTEVEEVQCAMNQMKTGKASGSTEVALEMFKAGGDKCLKSLANIFYDILFKNKLPEEWMLSSLVPIFNGKGAPLNPNSYRGIKLLEHAFKLYEKILDQRLREVVDIDKMQYGFMPGRGTIDAVFVSRRIMEKFRAKNKKLFFVFVDLEKGFWSGAKGSYLICFEAEGQPRIFGKWGYVSL